MARVHYDQATRAQVLFVRFPAGWRRPGPGWYEAAEELVLVEGTLKMSGETYRPGDWALVPAGYTRTETSAGDGVLAFARFDGPARWNEGEGPVLPLTRATLEPRGTGSASPLGSGRAWSLRDGAEDAAWLVDDMVPHHVSPVDAELFDLGARAWAWVTAGAALPAFGRSFCRTYSMLGSRP